jgi:uncharacterized NAD-dependent epimerase/dehydratase family protein
MEEDDGDSDRHPKENLVNRIFYKKMIWEVPQTFLKDQNIRYFFSYPEQNLILRRGLEIDSETLLKINNNNSSYDFSWQYKIYKERSDAFAVVGANKNKVTKSGRALKANNTLNKKEVSESGIMYMKKLEDFMSGDTNVKTYNSLSNSQSDVDEFSIESIIKPEEFEVYYQDQSWVDTKLEKAVILAEGVYDTSNGKTAHGLVRFTKRYEVIGVIDSKFAGKDAGEVLDGKFRNIPIRSHIKEFLVDRPEVLVIGTAPDGGLLPKEYRAQIIEAMKNKISIVSGLHEFLSEDPEFKKFSEAYNVKITDVRKMFLQKCDFFTGDIEKVKSKKIAVLGTDSAVGKRTTSVMLTEEFNKEGHSAIFIGTGQTGWMQGAKYCAIIDSMINDFVAGGIEAEVVKAWNDNHPEYIIIDGQGALLHPAYPGGFEIIAAGRPDIIILQHSPKRKYYDGFENYPIHDIDKYIKVIELLSGKKIAAITLNTENMTKEEIEFYKEHYFEKYGIPTFVPFYEEMSELVDILEKAD